MTEVAIKAVGLSKVYNRTELGAKREIPFFALKDVSFELTKGEVLGVIGSNGSGKSTLLRILSGITKPSEGHIEIVGRVASILDIGTGFHPDLSGRRNVYMRGQLLGMQKSEIDSVFDQIVEFSGVGRFIDSPVKHYSSGMFLRLAFSIIIHLSSDILILDEVMAVGDSEFRQKCAQRITEIVSGGKTVVMVSHDMRSVMNLCSLTALMKDGRMVTVDTPLKVVSDSYLSQLAGVGQNEDGTDKARSGMADETPDDVGLEIISAEVKHRGQSQDRTAEFGTDEDIHIEVVYDVKEQGTHLGISLNDFLSNRLIDDTPKHHSNAQGPDAVGRFSANWTIPARLLNSGSYHFNAFIFRDELKVLKSHMRLLEFKVIDLDDPESEKAYYRGAIAADLGLQLNRIG